MGKPSLVSSSRPESLGQKHIFLKAQLMTSISDDFDIINVKELIIKMIEEQFGVMGKSLPIDLLKFDKTSKEAILRCSDDSFLRLTSSLLFCTKYRNIDCYFKILKSSYSSLGLVAESRSYSHGSSKTFEKVLSKKRKHEETE